MDDDGEAERRDREIDAAQPRDRNQREARDARDQSGGEKAELEGHRKRRGDECRCIGANAEKRRLSD
jgi:hypothetical protein